MATFALPHDLFLDSSADAFEGYGSGAITPLFIPVANHGSGEIQNDGTRTPVHYGNDFDVEKLFRNEVAMLQSKLQKLEKAQGSEKMTTSASNKLRTTTTSGYLAPPGLRLAQPSAASSAAPAAPAPARWQVSVGTVGHPFSCGAPCPTGGVNCPDGAKCAFCHECQECKKAPQVGPLSLFSALEPVAPARSDAPGLKDSVGTAGHPYTCGNACRYVKRKAGCRMGADCTDCHLCHWQRTPLPKPAAPKASLSTIIMGTGLPHQAAEDHFDWCSPCEEVPLAMPRKVEIDTHPPAETAGPLFDVEDSAVTTQQDKVHLETLIDHLEADSCPSVGSIGHPHSCGRACKYVRKRRGCKDGKLCVCCHLCLWRRYQPAKDAQFAGPAEIALHGLL